MIKLLTKQLSKEKSSQESNINLWSDEISHSLNLLLPQLLQFLPKNNESWNEEQISKKEKQTGNESKNIHQTKKKYHYIYVYIPDITTYRIHAQIPMKVWTHML